jgi:uncharacterized protein YecT (DUF1311 family)
MGATVAASATPTTTTLPTVTYDRSCESTAQTQIALDECAIRELKQLRGKLHTALAQERKRIRAKLVNAAQKAFLSYERTECLATASINSGGSIYPLIVSECEIDLTVQRIQQVASDTNYSLS